MGGDVEVSPVDPPAVSERKEEREDVSLVVIRICNAILPSFKYTIARGTFRA